MSSHALSRHTMSRQMRMATAIAPIANTSSFLIGPDGAGHWVALERHGRGGGLFRTCQDAIRYARGECGGRLDAVRLVRHTLSLLRGGAPR